MTDLSTAISEHFERKRTEAGKRTEDALRAMQPNPELEQLAELRTTDRATFDRMPAPMRNQLSAYEARKRAAAALPTPDDAA